ncbi:MAG TPA: 5-deoxy-glucuronate isomerase [Clostridia bacterium]|nr:5-deoxy-glucuronate isomerase [Clostridia bacterium]
MTTQVQKVVEKMVFRHTNAHVGRLISVTPENSTNRHLAYGRIILNESVSTVSFSNLDRETGFVVLQGEADVCIGDESTKLRKFDSIYIPRNSSIQVSTSSTVDIAEFSADVQHQYPLQIVRFAEISKDPGLVFSAGEGTQASRHLHMSLAKNIQAGRLVVGFTWSEPGNWTSWPPHEHTAMLEEMYVYFNMPAPAFGIQLVYDDTEYPEFLTVVREGDAVTMPSGYHPNVSVPGHRIGFLWAMAAHREVEDRKFGVVTVQPGFDKGGSGLEKGQSK